MDKRYQVFLSSTYQDLQAERREVLQALMEMDCIPAGMELFPATDEQQWQFIKKVIDDCDYYLLIIGGRYGSLSSEGISYTEKEYDYAVSIGLPVVAFIHGAPEQLSVAKSDIAPELRTKLESFRNKVASGRLVKFWTDSAALPGSVALSLQKTIKTNPRVGWVRATSISQPQALAELNDVRKENEALRQEMEALRARERAGPRLTDLAPLESSVTISGRYQGSRGANDPWHVSTTWSRVFAQIAPKLLAHPHDSAVKEHLEGSLFATTGLTNWGTSKPKMSGDDFETIKVQLMAHGLVLVEYTKTVQGGMGLFWRLTAAGTEALMTLRTVRSSTR